MESGGNEPGYDRRGSPGRGSALLQLYQILEETLPPTRRKIRGTVLGLFAHPDDETFGPGGTLARLAQEGNEVHLLCATRGEAGTIGDSAGLGRRLLASTRMNELEEACRALGISSPTILPFPDSGLGRLEEETLLRPFVREIRRVRPDLLISFHADGISGHLDHQTVTARAVTAFDLASDPERWPDLGPTHAAARLWTYGIPQTKAGRITYRRIHAVPDAEVDASIDVGQFLRHKRVAVAAHASQKPFIEYMEQKLGGLDDFWNEEAFVLARARVPLPEDAPRPVKSLWLGMEDS